MRQILSLYLSESPHGLMFHRFHRRGSLPAGQGSIASDELEEILNFAGIENIISPEEWLFKLKNNKLSKNDLCITLDDGLRCQYDICLPILERYGLKAFWFIYSSVCEGGVGKFEIYNRFGTEYFGNTDEFYGLFFKRCAKYALKALNENRFRKYADETLSAFPFYSINDLKFRFIRNEVLDNERFENILDAMIEEKGINIDEISKNLWLSNSELKILSKKGHHIGLHSYDHPFVLSRLSGKEQFNQYLKNYTHIKEICHDEVFSMSHPVNSYNTDTLKALKRLGILCGFRSNMTPPDGKGINPSPLEIAREDSINILKAIRKG